MTKLLFKIIALILITIVLTSTFANINDYITIKFQDTEFEINIVLSFILLLTSIISINYVMYIIRMLINSPKYIKEYIQKTKNNSDLSILKRILICNHLNYNNNLTNLIDQINDSDIKFFASEYFLNNTTKYKSEIMDILINIEELIKKEVDYSEIKSKFNNIISTIPELENMFKQKISRQKAIKLLSNNQHQDANKELISSFNNYPNHNDLLLLININSNSEKILSTFVEKYWDRFKSYEIFSAIISNNNNNLLPEENIENVKKLFNKIENNSWKIMLNYYLAKQHRLDLIDFDIFDNSFNNISYYNENNHLEYIYIYCMLIKGETAIVKYLLQQYIETNSKKYKNN